MMLTMYHGDTDFIELPNSVERSLRTPNTIVPWQLPVGFAGCDLQDTESAGDNYLHSLADFRHAMGISGIPRGLA